VTGRAAGCWSVEAGKGSGKHEGHIQSRAVRPGNQRRGHGTRNEKGGARGGGLADGVQVLSRSRALRPYVGKIKVEKDGRVAAVRSSGWPSHGVPELKKECESTKEERVAVD
jgi:hypothetical protein